MTIFAYLLIWVPLLWAFCHILRYELHRSYLQRDYGPLQWQVFCCRFAYSRYWFVRRFGRFLWAGR